MDARLTAELARRLAVEYAERAADAIEDFEEASKRVYGGDQAARCAAEATMYATSGRLLLALLDARLLPTVVS